MLALPATISLITQNHGAVTIREGIGFEPYDGASSLSEVSLMHPPDGFVLQKPWQSWGFFLLPALRVGRQEERIHGRRMRRFFRWFFENRETGVITIAQAPNLSLWIVIVASVLIWRGTRRIEQG